MVQLSHIQAKQLFRFLTLRSYLIGVKGDGLYYKSMIKDASKATGLSYITWKRELGLYQDKKWIETKGRMIRLRKLDKQTDKYRRMFTKHRQQIFAAENPAIFFAGIVKAYFFKQYLITQGIAEAYKAKDKSSRASLLRHVKRKATTLGVLQGVHAGIRKVGSLYEKKATTGWKYLKQMEATGIIKVHRHVLELKKADWNDEIYGMTYFRKGRVFLRLLNSYSWGY